MSNDLIRSMIDVMTVAQLREAAEGARGEVEKHAAVLAAIEEEIERRGELAPKKKSSGSTRGPGRPRKHPLPDPNAPKRPRGRPRKAAPESYSAEAAEG